MKIILAAGIFPPDIGGPATYTEKLAKEFYNRKIKVKVICYSDVKEYGNYNFPVIRISRKYPLGIRHFLYFWKLLKTAKDADVIYAQNAVSAGLPALLAAKIFRKKIILRLGGDLLWERAVESGKTNKPMQEYYKEPKTLKEKFWILVSKKILNSADKIIFTSNFQKEIYQIYYGVKKDKAIIVHNPFPEFNNGISNKPIANYELLYAGRLIKLKNLPLFLDVFAEVLEETRHSLRFRIIGQGPEEDNLRKKIKRLKLENNVSIEKSVSHQQLLKEIQKSYLCVLVSLTDITSNFVLDCLKLRKPILLTKETEYFYAFRDNLIFINPCDKADIKKKIIYLLDSYNYQSYVQRIKKIPVEYSWDRAANKHMLLFNV